ncbi:hypothetical protein [Amycolatopsis kentuckyensis]|uniref:hypothetical protein n=1 Tax=Amycolatopsis kentuckyensis TaxID=218823 RepID=UPI001FC94C03|nr:hypothetical protein [Amycolatopsis kentuckyensis]
MGRWITKNGNRIYIEGGAGPLVAVTAAVVLAGGGVAGAGAGGLFAGGGGVGAGTASEVFAGNTAGDVVDSLPGRSIKTRRAEGRESARKGKPDEAWSKLKVKQLRREVHDLEHAAECVAAATDKVREFLVRTPCSSLHRMLLAVGDGHGNAAVISVVRVGFRSKKQAAAFEKVERVQGSGDVRPLDVAVVLGVAGTKMTGLHYASRPEGYGMVVAEADNATGHFDGEELDALAEVASWMSIRK